MRHMLESVADGFKFLTFHIGRDQMKISIGTISKGEIKTEIKTYPVSHFSLLAMEIREEILKNNIQKIFVNVSGLNVGVIDFLKTTDTLEDCLKCIMAELGDVSREEKLKIVERLIC